MSAPITRQWPTVWRWKQHRSCVRDISKSSGHGHAKFTGFGEYIGIKKGLTDNTHGDVRHLLVDIDHAIVAPGSLNLLPVVSENACIIDNMAWLEGWRHDLALAAVEVAFAAEDAVADYG